MNRDSSGTDARSGIRRRDFLGTVAAESLATAWTPRPIPFELDQQTASKSQDDLFVINMLGGIRNLNAPAPKGMGNDAERVATFAGLGVKIR